MRTLCYFCEHKDIAFITCQNMERLSVSTEVRRNDFRFTKNNDEIETKYNKC